MADRKNIRARRRRGHTGSKKHKLIAGIIIGIIAILLLGALGSYRLFHWLQSDGFRMVLQDSLANRAQADSVLIPQNLSIDEERVSLPQLQLQRNDILQKASARRMLATIERGALLDRCLRIRKLTIEEATVQLDTAAIGKPLPPVKKGDSGFFSRFAPNTAELHALECSDADAVLKHNNETYGMGGCRVTAIPQKNGKNWQITLENGRVHTPFTFLQNCSIRTASLLYTPANTTLSECRLILSPGELRGQGVYRHDDGQWYATTKANKANVERLLNEDWKKRLSGELYGELKLTGSGSKLNEASGNLSLQQGVMEGLPILSRLPFADTQAYRTLHLEKVTCRISYPYAQPKHNIRNAWLFDCIDIRARGGLLRVKGHVIVAPGGVLRGTLTIGLPNSIADSIAALAPDTANSIFNATGDADFRWLNVNLSGTTDAPQEDLTARLGTILAAGATQTAGKAVQSAGNLLNSIIPKHTPESETTDKATPTPAIPAPSPTDLLDILF